VSYNILGSRKGAESAGYWFLENADESAGKDKEQYSPPDGLEEFMEKAKSKGKKIVYM
jgi:sterol 3beta-glucosyltransferase